MNERTYDAWGWSSAGGGIQEETFLTPCAAIEEMQSRLGKDFDMARIESSGFRLCRVSVTVKALSVMEPCR